MLTHKSLGVGFTAWFVGGEWISDPQGWVIIFLRWVQKKRFKCHIIKGFYNY